MINNKNKDQKYTTNTPTPTSSTTTTLSTPVVVAVVIFLYLCKTARYCGPTDQSPPLIKGHHFSVEFSLRYICNKRFLFLYGWIAGGWEAHFRNYSHYVCPVGTLKWLPNFPHKAWVDPGEGSFTCQVNRYEWWWNCDRLYSSRRRRPLYHSACLLKRKKIVYLKSTKLFWRKPLIDTKWDACLTVTPYHFKVNEFWID